MGSFSIWHWLIVVVMAGAYLLPAFIAFGRGHANALAITALNVLLGWTGLGWVGAFVWSLTANVRRQ